MIIIGGGLGGLLTAALFSRDRKITVFERARQVGGRFRNFHRDGYALTTGALHMIPHGSKGPLANILRMVGAQCDIVDSHPYGTFMHGGCQLRLHELRKSLSIWDKIKLSRMFLQMRYFNAPNVSVADYLLGKFNDEIAFKVAKCFLGWSLSVSPYEFSMMDFSPIVKNIFRYGGPGVPMGGCSGVISSLLEVLERNKVEIIFEKVDSILVEEGKVIGISTADGRDVMDDLIVSDIGARATSDLCPNDCLDHSFKERIDKIEPAAGIKINFSSDKPLIGHNGILFPLDCERVEGIIEVTSVDSSLAPPGKHLLMSHQTLVGRNIGLEIDKGIADIEETFKKNDIDIICAQTYYGKNPVNRASQGQDMKIDALPIEGLYLVGDGVKGLGGIEVDGVALGVLELYKRFYGYN